MSTPEVQESPTPPALRPAQKQVFPVPGGTSNVVTLKHALDTVDIASVSVWLVGADRRIEVQLATEVIDASTINLHLGTPPQDGQFIAVVTA